MIHYISCFRELWHNERNVADALEWHGCDVQCYEISDPRNRPETVEPDDIVFTSVPQSLPVADLERYKQAGAKLVCWYWDWLWGFGNRETEYLPRLRLMDAIFSTDGSDDKEYVSRGVNNRYWLTQAAMPEDRLLPPRFGTPQHDVVFIGHVWTDERRKMRAQLAAKFNFAVYGDFSRDSRRVWGREMTSLCQNSKIMLGVNYRNDIPGYWSDRCYVMMGAGGFYLGQYVPGIERQFKDGVHCGFFDGPEDMERKIVWWLKHDKEREACRLAGHKLVHEKHTYIHRVGELLDVWRGLRLIQ